MMKGMTNDDFFRWRTAMGYSRASAAKALGLGVQTVANYELGYRSDVNRPVPIPKSVELACAALAAGIKKYDGPSINLLPLSSGQSQSGEAS